MPDVVDAAKDADILVFVVPHQFINRLCDQLAGKIKATAIGLSLIKVYPLGLCCSFNLKCSNYIFYFRDFSRPPVVASN